MSEEENERPSDRSRGERRQGNTLFFWDVKGLKRELARGISERACMRYLLAVLLAPWLVEVVVSLPTLLISFDYDSLDLSREHLVKRAQWMSRAIVAGEMSCAVVLLVGVIFCFKKNGGSSGRSFLPRFVALAWVCGLRMVVCVIAPLLLLSICVIAGLTDDGSVGIAIQWGILEPLAMVLILWRIGTHLGALWRSDHGTHSVRG